MTASSVTRPSRGAAASAPTDFRDLDFRPSSPWWPETHRTSNQPPPLQDYNCFLADAALLGYLDVFAGGWARSESERDCYCIAVQREDKGEGGPSAMHQSWQLGTRINVDAPENHFPLHDDERPALLIASGIGITPIKATADALAARGGKFELH